MVKTLPTQMQQEFFTIGNRPMKFTFIFLLFLNCCSGINEQSEKEKILETILNTTEFKKYHHSELQNRTPLYLLNNGQFDNVKLPGLKVVDDTTGTKGNYVDFDKLVIKKRQAEFDLYYKIENMNMGGSLLKKNKKWHINKFDYIIEL